jgi:hypothetical protein
MLFAVDVGRPKGRLVAFPRRLVVGGRPLRWWVNHHHSSLLFFGRTSTTSSTEYHPQGTPGYVSALDSVPKSQITGIGSSVFGLFPNSQGKSVRPQLNAENFLGQRPNFSSTQNIDAFHWKSHFLACPSSIVYALVRTWLLRQDVYSEYL